MSPTSHVLSYSFYPGCSLHASAKEYEVSARALFHTLRIGLNYAFGAPPPRHEPLKP